MRLLPLRVPVLRAWGLSGSLNPMPIIHDATRPRPRPFSTIVVKLPPDIVFEELKQKLSSNKVTLLDVRNKKEFYTDGMIPNSKHLPLPQLGTCILQSDENYASVLGYDKPGVDDPIVVSCLAGVRARTAQLALLGAGYTNVRVYAGSFEDWVEKGGKVEFPEDEEKQK